MIIGRRAVDKTRPTREHNLVDWARPLLVHNRKLFRIIDPRMEGQYSTKAAIEVASLAYRCLSQNPKGRPTMSQVVETFEAVQNMPECQDILLQNSITGAVTLYEVPKEPAESVEGEGQAGTSSKDCHCAACERKASPPEQADTAWEWPEQERAVIGVQDVHPVTGLRRTAARPGGACIPFQRRKYTGPS